MNIGTVKVIDGLYNITVQQYGSIEDHLFMLPHYPYVDEDHQHTLKVEDIEQALNEKYSVTDIKIIGFVKVEEAIGVV